MTQHHPRIVALTRDWGYVAAMGNMPSNSPDTRPDGLPYAMAKTEDEWRQELTDPEYHVLRQAGTEAPFVGEYTDTKTEGVYTCKACTTELFRSTEKFDSHCGWPSFFEPLAQDRVIYLEDRAMGRVRTEVRCAGCGSHLGHVFEGEGYETPTDLRFCINSIALRFDETTQKDN